MTNCRPLKYEAQPVILATISRNSNLVGPQDCCHLDRDAEFLNDSQMGVFDTTYTKCPNLNYLQQDRMVSHITGMLRPLH